MNSIHNNGPDDKSLKHDLEDLGQAYRQFSSDEPPELLDKAILNSAHRAVEKKDHWLDFGWIHGATTVAVVVLALSIILTQRQPADLDENGLSPAGARDEPVAARKSQDVFRTKKSMQVEDALLEEGVIQLNASAESMLAAPTATEFSDEEKLAETAEVEIDAIKSDADKIAAERLQLSPEEAQLQAILQLKQAGDAGWEAALKTFIERYPDYPLPDELKD